MRKVLPALLSAAILLGVAAAGLAVGGPRAASRRDDPRASLPSVTPHLEHGPFFAEPFARAEDVTLACLRCHPGAADEVMQTTHWTWAGQEAVLPGHATPSRLGKRNLINNFCVSIAGNWPRCTSCHAGYGWRDGEFFASARPEQVDCLVCHDRSGQYVKDPAGAGYPAEGVDLLVAARSVGRPGRENCGACHFAGGGGDAVKHGDMDGTMNKPTARIDVHMGRHGLVCVDCHVTEQHRVRGRILPLAVHSESRIRCTDCHAEAPHQDDRLNGHTRALACQACHIDRVAIDAATKTSWDWSQAGQDPARVAAADPEVAEDPHLYSKAKGRFTYVQGLVPEYAWYDGTSARYLPGTPIDPESTVEIVRPNGSARDPGARIWPFKVHRGKQVYDTEYRYLLYPKTFGPGGYWADFDWDEACRLGAEASGQPYSGGYGFVSTEMWWPLTHMIQPRERAVACRECHGGGRLDWERLGYPGDPARQGGRAGVGLLDPEGGR